MKHTLNRRELLLKSLFGSGLIGLQGLATGIPAGILMNPGKAFAEGMGTFVNPQFFILSTSTYGDPINANAPGTYISSDIGHAKDPSIMATDIKFGSEMIKGAQVWSTLNPALLSRACFFHHATRTVVHPDEAKALRIQSALNGEMLPSMLSKSLAPELKTVRRQPISLSGDVNETIYCEGAPMPLLTPTTLSTDLSTPSGPLGMSELVKMRDSSLNKLNNWLKESGTKSQKEFVDQYALSKDQLRKLQEDLKEDLATLIDNSPLSQIKAALLLFEMRVTPVVTVHNPFGGGNHADEGLVNEIEGHKSGMATINGMWDLLKEKPMLQDKVTFGMFNVFGRTLKAGTIEDGRNHNDKHAVCLMIGDNIKPSVVGGINVNDANLAASAIDSATGKADAKGDITFAESFASMGKTLVRACGVPTEVINKEFRAEGKIVTGSLKI